MKSRKLLLAGAKAVLFLLLLSPLSVIAKNPQDTTLVQKKSLYRGYVGGMMVHLGYGSGGTLRPVGYDALNVSGVTSGIGGKIAVMLGDHLRVGTEGYVSTINYGDNRKASLGWGGLSADYGWIWGKWRGYLGAVIGGGSYENQASMETPLNSNIPQMTVWHSYGVFIVDPYIEVNYSITKKIMLCAKVDWITSPSARNMSYGDFSSGPRLYIGFMFTR